MIRKAGTVCDGIQHYHYFIILKRFDLALTRLSYPYRIETVGNVSIYYSIPVELLEKHGYGRFLSGEGFVAVLVDIDRPVLPGDRIVPAVVYEQIDVDSFDLIVPMTHAHILCLLELGVSKSKIYDLGKDVSDPYNKSISCYRETRDELKVCMEQLADFIEGELAQEK